MNVLFKRTDNKSWLLIITVLLSLLPLPASLHAAAMTDYCIKPPLIGANIMPNLLLMIDNSASQYDLFYQDTSKLYCMNDPAGSSCTSDSNCTAAAVCLASGVTTTVTTWSPKPCSSNANCTASGSKCTSGFCTKCNTSTGVGDCVVLSTTTTFTPTSCTLDSQCRPPSANGVAGDQCNNKCSMTRQCFDSSYSTTTTYSGYFVSSATYSYDFTNNKFISGATMPGTCTYSAGTTKYLCINTTGTGATEVISTGSTGFVAKGNFLNWLTASKFDIEKQILTGGKFDTTNSVLLAETRGCSGRKFIKSVSGVSLTFAIRGGTPAGIGDTTNQASEYGQTYIDLYTGTYNVADCLKAASDWAAVSSSTPPTLGSFQNDTKGCVGAGNGVLNGTSMWNHILHDCYQGMTGGAGGYSTNLGTLENECAAIYATGMQPGDMTDPNAGYAVCSDQFTYTDSSGTVREGYLGRCWNGTNFTKVDPLNDVTQMANFCIVNVNSNPVADPSSTAISDSAQSAPGFIMEQGLMNTIHVGTLTVKVATTPAPTGLIDKYKDQIRFGAMAFQNNGSGSECGTGITCAKACRNTTTLVFNTRMCYLSSDCVAGETCETLSKTDGGQILSYVGAGNCSVSSSACDVDAECPSGEVCIPSVGSHSSGLIKIIDDMPATSWTPFAETFYNALGYFSRTNAYVSPPVTPISKDFNITASASASYNVNKNPSQYNCQKNNILVITDGMSTTDLNTQSESLASSASGTGKSGYTSGTTSCTPAYKGSTSLPTLAWLGQNRDIKSLPTLTPWKNESEHINTFVVYSGLTSTALSGLCSPYTLMQTTATLGGTALLQASDPAGLTFAINNALEQVASKSVSGTAASVLASGEGSGANLVQAIFYPTKKFGNDQIAWIGKLSNYWYFVDPSFTNSNIREEGGSSKDYKLNLFADGNADNQKDYILHLYYNAALRPPAAVADRYLDTNGDAVEDGLAPSPSASVDLESIGNLWEAGQLLWSMPTTSRKIKTYNITSTATSDNLIDFSTTNKTALRSYLTATSDNESEAIIRYIQGEDNLNVGGFGANYRSRLVSIGTGTHTWKLGDILNSTPKIASWLPVNTYHKAYMDPTYGAPGVDSFLDDPVNTSQFVNTATYKRRGIVYAGANDGMFHAFKLGRLKLKWTGQGLYEKAWLDVMSSATDSIRTPLGTEVWSYIPKNVLPYLKYMADPNYAICHLFSVDLTPIIFDASIATPTGCSESDTSKCTRTAESWRTIVIGGMRFGGACGCTTANCVQPPVSNNGFSSYFALDITDQFDSAGNPLPPKLLWEFTDPELGFASAGGSIVRISGRNAANTANPQMNGKWFFVTGSGPTGPINKADQQFMGQSDQPLKIFIIDVLAGPGANNANVITKTTSISDAFSGSLANATQDVDLDYQDDVLYVPFTTKDSSVTPPTWTKGGVGRLLTRENPDPAQWEWSIFKDGIGPVTTSVVKLENQSANTLWVFFGSGRYFYERVAGPDDPTNRQQLWGIKDPCFDSNGFKATCPTVGAITNVDDINTANGINSALSTFNGWNINLDETASCVSSAGGTAQCRAERIITDPLATATGMVFFTSYKPYDDPCLLGGKSSIWALKYDTGGAPGTLLKGKAIVQVSTGSIEQVDLSKAFTEKDNRRTGTLEGVPPSGQGLSLLSAPVPQKRFMHVKER